MNLLTFIFKPLAALGNVIVRVASGLERGANSFDQAMRALETKSTNFANLVEMNDEATFEKEKARIAKRRAKYLKSEDAKVEVESVQAQKRKERKPLDAPSDV